jgi:hypothetical protein
MFPGANLLHLKLHRVGISWNSHLLSQGLAYLHLNDLPHGTRLTRQEIRDVLGRMPGLKHLFLGSILAELGDFEGLPRLSPVQLPFLKELMITDSVKSLVHFFGLITFPGTLNVLQVHALRYDRDDHLAFTNAIAEKLQDSSTNWTDFWSHEVQAMIITTKRARSMAPARAIFQGITDARSGKAVDRAPVGLPESGNSQTYEFCTLQVWVSQYQLSVLVLPQ